MILWQIVTLMLHESFLLVCILLWFAFQTDSGFGHVSALANKTSANTIQTDV